MASLSESGLDFLTQPVFFNQRQFCDDLAHKPVIKVFKDAIDGVNKHFDRRFEEGEDIRILVQERAVFIDLILHYAWHQFSWGKDVCLVAVGGYGRRELHPYSDIDLLILLDDAAEGHYANEIQPFITLLWDIGLGIGSSVRTLSQCVALAETDITVATNVMESRTVCGHDKLRDQLQVLTSPRFMWPAVDFYRGKYSEQIRRHKKHQFTECNLEPNVKNSPGGLRDIQTIYWVAKRYYGVQTIEQLVGHNFFTEQEHAQLRNSEAFLWKVRYGLHKLTKRPEERLLFEYQRELAKSFGYLEAKGVLAVERFMHDYYRAVLGLRELNDLLLRILDERIRQRDATHQSIITPINDDFQLINQYIGVCDDHVFDRHPTALMDIFVWMSENPAIKGVQADTIRLIREKRALVDDAFRQNIHIKAQFIKLFTLERGLIIQLRRMKRYGILGLYLPEFDRITGQMQHDLFHRYTVDAHTLLVMKNIRSFRAKSAVKTFPLAARVIKKIDKPALLYIAALYHDIGKGRGGDHSILGAEDAEQFCQAHGFSADDTALVKWLVEKHLLMSYVSQKRDISDPDVIHYFAQQVDTLDRLDLLYTLTIADMCGTNPDIWNSWRASLMRQLYSDTRTALLRGLEHTLDTSTLVATTQQQASDLLKASGFNNNQFEALWHSLDQDYFIRESAQDIAWQTQQILEHLCEEPLVAIINLENTTTSPGATQIFILTRESANVFVATASALANLGLNIQDARIYTTANQLSWNIFYVLDEFNQHLINDPRHLENIQKTLVDELRFVDQYSAVIHRRTSRQLKQFAIPTTTRMHKASHANVSVLEVISPDRPGLLATIGRIFIEQGVRLQTARISTLGERVEDTFFITDVHGQPFTDPQLCEQLQNTICHQLNLRVGQDL